MSARRLTCYRCNLEGPALVGKLPGNPCPSGCGGSLVRMQLALPDAPEIPPPAPRAPKGPDHTRIVAYIREHGPSTCDEVEVGLGLPHQTASARITELVKTQRLEDSGARRRTRAGGTARVLTLPTKDTAR